MKVDMKVFNKTLLLVLMISGASVYPMDLIKKKAKNKKPASSLFARLTCCISQAPSAQVVTLRPIDRTLIDAATVGDAADVQFALEIGAQVNAQDAKGNTALFRAIEGSCNWFRNTFRNYPGVVDALMNAGADVTLRNNEGYNNINFLCVDAKGTIPPIMVRVIKGIHANYKEHMYDSNEHDSTPSPLHWLLGHFLRSVLYQKNSDSVTATKPLVDAILCAGFDMTVKGRANVYQMGSGQAATDFIGAKALRGHGDRDARIEQRKKMLASTESAIFAFQKKHRTEIERVIGNSIHADLLPLIYECLYIRPYEDARISRYLKELLTMRLSPRFKAEDVAQRVKQIKNGGGVVPSLKTEQGKEMLNLAVVQGNGPLVKDLEQPSKDASPATAAANS